MILNSSCERAQTLRQSQARGAGRRDPHVIAHTVELIIRDLRTHVTGDAPT
jgi:hypothetical protein